MTLDCVCILRLKLPGIAVRESFFHVSSFIHVGY